MKSVPLKKMINSSFKLSIFILIITLRFSGFAVGQTPTLRFEHLTTDEGLSHSNVLCILQDHYGYLWFGTVDGLSKYDGYEFTVYRQDDKDTNSLKHNIISSLYEDHNGNLWVGTYNGLCLYNRDKDNFFHCNKKNGYPLDDFAISNIFQDSQNKLWLCTDINGLIEYDLKTNKSIHYTHNKNDTNSINSNLIGNVLEDSKGNFWICSFGGLDLFDRKSKTFIHYYKFRSNDSIRIVGSNGFPIVEDIKGNIWFSFRHEGLYCLNLNELDKHSITNFRHNPKNSQSLSNNLIPALYPDKNGGLWIGTNNGGLDFLEKDMKTFIHYKNNESDPNSLNNNSIYSIYQDKTGDIWIGTYSGGVNVIHHTKQAFKHYKSVPYNPNSLSHNSVTGFHEDHEGNIWITTDGGGLNMFNPKSGTFVTYNSKNTNLNNDAVHAVDVDANDNIWITTWGGGVNLFNRQTRSFSTFTKEKNKLSSNEGLYMQIDRHGNLWACNLTLDKLNHGDLQFTATNLGNGGVIKEDSKGNMLIGRFTGLSIFNPITKRLENYVHDPKNENSLSNNFVTSIFAEDSVIVWIATSNGLNRLNRITKHIDKFFKRDGLASNFIVGIEKDDKGFFWISTNGGLSRFDFKTKKSKNFTKEDGLQGNAFIRKSHYHASDGKMYFGGVNGFNVFDPNQVMDNTYIPPVVITDFQIYNKPVPIGTKDSPLQKHISITNEIILTYKQSVFSFTFAALNYVSSSKNQYAYMLEGFDKDWNYIGTKRTANYTNIDPGHYTFKVKASNNEGYWNEKGASVKVIILPPWWKEWWFRILVFLLVASIIVSFYYIRFSFFNKQRQKLEEMVHKRTIELESTTSQLEEQQEEINLQKEELINQRDELFQANDLLLGQKEKIVEQNTELYKHRHELELLVDQRTHELIDAKEKAEESDRLKSSFLANLSHEIRTPLNAIIGFSRFLGEDNLSVEDKSKFYQIVENSGLSLLSLIEDIIDFSKIESGYINVYMNEVPINKVLENIHQIFDLQLKRQLKSKKDIEFKVVLDKNIDKLVLWTDEVRLNQVLANLINNAIKFTNEGKIEVGYHYVENKQFIELYVKDTGIGIKKENHQIIFQRFRKIEEPNTELYRGAGLGLAISHQLVHLLGGIIHIESEPLKGSTFFFTIPLSTQLKLKPFTNSNLNTNQIPDLKNSKILIAEDDEANLEYLKKLMQKTNCDVICAINGLQVLSLLEKNEDFVLILMDIKMPLMDGHEALKEIKKRKIKIPVIAQTAFALSNEISTLGEEGFDDYISKPIVPSDLYHKVRRVLNI